MKEYIDAIDFISNHSKSPFTWTQLLYKYDFSEEIIERMIPYVDFLDIIKSQQKLSLEFIVNKILLSNNKLNHNELDLTIEDICKYQNRFDINEILAYIKNNKN